MKKKINVQLLSIMVTIFISGGCSSLPIDGVMPSLEVSTSIISIDRTPTPFHEQSTTPSLLPEQTPTPTVTSSPNYSPTLMPSLPADDANHVLLELLEGNGGCRLPCLWGITPGVSSFQDAVSILLPLSSISLFTDLSTGPGDIKPVYTEGDLYVLTSVQFRVDRKSNLVDLISIAIGSNRRFPDEGFLGGYGYSEVFDIPRFGKIAANYMLSGILSEYGPPDSVWVLAYGGPPGNYTYNYFEIVLLYTDQGMLVHYTTQKRMVGDNILGCMENAHVQLLLAPSGNAESFMELLALSWKERLANYKPVYELTSMSVGDFYETFRNPTEKCITIKNQLLPTWLP